MHDEIIAKLEAHLSIIQVNGKYVESFIYTGRERGNMRI